MEIKLRFIEISADTAAKTLMVSGDAHKLKALDVLGITQRDGETPLQAWIRAMCEENNLPYTQPAPREIADAICQNSSTSRFIWLLA